MQFWLTLGITTVTCVIPVSLYQRINTLYNDGIINNLRVQKYEFGLKIKKISRKIEKMAELTRSFAKFKKILNDNKFTPDNQADKKIKNLVDQYTRQNHQNNLLTLKLNTMNFQDSSKYSRNLLYNPKHNNNKSKFVNEEIVYNKNINLAETKNNYEENKNNENSNKAKNKNIINFISIGVANNKSIEQESKKVKSLNENYFTSDNVIHEEEKEESLKIDITNQKMEKFFKELGKENKEKEEYVRQSKHDKKYKDSKNVSLNKELDKIKEYPVKKIADNSTQDEQLKESIETHSKNDEKEEK